MSSIHLCISEMRCDEKESGGKEEMMEVKILLHSNLVRETSRSVQNVNITFEWKVLRLDLVDESFCLMTWPARNRYKEDGEGK